MSLQQPVLSAPGAAPILNLGESQLVQRIRSDQTGGAFSVVEFISEPGAGVGVHIHEREDELVYLLEGEIGVTLGDQTMTVPAGACALLPRGIPHGYINTGGGTSRLLTVLLPGALDGFFVGLDAQLAAAGPHEEAVGALCDRFGLRFIETSNR